MSQSHEQKDINQDNKLEKQQDEFVDDNPKQFAQDTPQSQKFIELDSIKAEQFKSLGKNSFQHGQYQQAIELYRKALQYTNSENNNKLRAVLYSNIAICYSKLPQPNNSQIINYCQKSDPKYYKAWLNLGKYQQLSQQYEQALESYKQTNKIDIQNNRKQQFIIQKIQFLESKVKEINQKRKQQVLTGLKSVGNSILGYFGMSIDNFKLQPGSGGGYNISYNPNK